MAGNKITRKDIVEEKVISIGQDYAKGLQSAIDANEKWLQSFKPIKEAALAQANISKQFSSVKGQKEFLQVKKLQEEATIKATKALEAEQKLLIAKQKAEQSVIDTEKKGLTLAQQKIKSQQRNIKLSEEEKLEIRLLNKGKREAAVISSKLSTEYEKQAVRLTQLRRKYKDVALTQGESSKQAITLRNEIKKLDARLKRVDANVGQFQRNVGNYGKAMQSARNAARSLAGALGLVGGAFLAVQVARDAANVIKDFEKQNATLSAILQVEREQMKGLTEDAVRLGSVTVKTAGEVTQLQIAYARLGFSQKEILDLTESTISGSIAMNSELDQTANLVGAIVNTFDDFSSTDAPQIIDIISLSTAKSALNFEKLEKAIPIVAGAANAANIPFTKLIALLGKLSDSGIDASSSSTALRNIFIESAAQGLSYEQILEKIKNSQDKLTASNDEFGKRAAVSAVVLSQNIDATKELDDALNDAAGTAQRMADKELDTLDGALQLLKSAWQGVILETDNANDISTQLKDAIKFLAENLKTMLTTLFNITKAFLIYKGILLAVSLITRGYAAATVALRVAKIALAGGIRKATLAMKAFNLATKASPIGLLIGLLSGAVAIWASFSSGVKEAKDEQKLFNDELDRLNRIGDRFTSALNNVAKGQERLNAAVAEQFNLIDNIDKVLEKEGESASLRNEHIKELTSLRVKDAEAAKKFADEEFSGYSEYTRKKIANFIVANNAIEKVIDENYAFLQTKRDEEIQEEEKARKQRLKDEHNLAKQIVEIEIEKQEEILKNEDAKSNDKLNASFDLFKAKKDLLDLEKEYAVANAKGRTAELKRIDIKYNDDLKKLEQERKNNTTNVFKKTTTDLIEAAKKRREEIKAAQEENVNSEITALQKQLQQELAVQGLSNKAKLKKIEEYEKAVLKIREEADINALKAEINALKAIDITLLNDEQRLAIKQAISTAEINLSQLETNARINDINDQIEAEQKLAELKEQLVFEASNNIAEALNLDSENISKFLTGVVDGFDSSLEAISATAAVVGDVFSSIYDNNIRKLDEQKQANDDYYTELLAAEELSTEQRDALEAERDKKNAEIEKKKREEMRKKAISEKVFGAFQVGINTAVAITKVLPNLALVPLIAALGALQLAAIAAAPIPKFAKGTQNAPEGWALVDEERPEVHTDKHGNIKSTGSTKGANLRYLERGDKIYKSHEDYERLMRASILTSVEADNKRLSNFKTKHVFNLNNDKLIEEMRLTREAIVKNRPKINLYNNNSITEDLKYLNRGKDIL